MIVDATSDLTSEIISQFGQALNDDDAIQFKRGDFIITETTKANLVNDILIRGLDKSQVKDDDNFSLVSNKMTVLFNGYNYLWWKKTAKRIEKFKSKLMAVPVETKKKETISIEEPIYCVGVAFNIDCFLSDIKWMKGTKSEVIDFINNDIFDKYKKTSIDANVVINLAFDSEKFCKVMSEGTEEEKDNYKRDLSMWYSISELADIGALTLK